MAIKFGSNKISKNHATAIDAAVEIIKFAQKSPLVNKISLGMIRQCRMGQGMKNIKIKTIPAGLELTIKGNAYTQTIYLYIESADENNQIASEQIEKAFYR